MARIGEFGSQRVERSDPQDCVRSAGGFSGSGAES